MAVDRPRSAADTRYRGKHGSRVRHQALLAWVTMMLALASISAVLIVLRDHDWSVMAMLGLEERSEFPASSAAEPADSGKSAPHASAARTGQNAAATGKEGDAGNAASAGDSRTARLANLAELVSEDGLLLTGMFGDGSQRLELSETQKATIVDVVKRLRENEKELKAKKLTLEQWYAACHKLGDELLAVLTDAQRQHLQVLLERKELQRMHLVDYAALIVPELAVAQMPWSVQTAGRSFRVIAGSTFTAAAQDRCCRASEPTGMLATLAVASAADAPHKLTVWDLVRNRRAAIATSRHRSRKARACCRETAGIGCWSARTKTGRRSPRSGPRSPGNWWARKSFPKGAVDRTACAIAWPTG